MHTSGSLHLGLHLMCFCVRGSSQKRHSVWRHLPGAVGACLCVCVCVVCGVCDREMRQGDEMADGGVSGDSTLEEDT